MSATWDRHFYHYFSFTDQETEAGFSNRPRVTYQGNGGAPIRFWAAWLQNHSLIRTRVAQENLREGGTFWTKDSNHLTEAAGGDREGVKGEFSGTHWKGLQCRLKAFGLDQEGRWRASEWTYPENNMYPAVWVSRRTVECVAGQPLWFKFGLSDHFCFNLWLSSGVSDFPLALSSLALRDQSLQNRSHQAAWAHCPTRLPNNSHKARVLVCDLPCQLAEGKSTWCHSPLGGVSLLFFQCGAEECKATFQSNLGNSGEWWFAETLPEEPKPQLSSEAWLWVPKS